MVTASLAPQNCGWTFKGGNLEWNANRRLETLLTLFSGLWRFGEGTTLALPAGTHELLHQIAIDFSNVRSVANWVSVKRTTSAIQHCP